MIFKRLTVGLSIAAFLVACSSTPTKQMLSAQEQADYAKRLSDIKKVEVFYSNDTSITIVDDGGSGSGIALAGLLGPIGLLAAVAVSAAHQSGAADRAKTRTKEFSDKVRADQPEINLSRDFAEAVAAKLRLRGMEVTTKALTTSRTNSDLATFPDLSKVEEGSAALVIWNNPGLYSPSATASYKLSVVVDYYCQDSAKRKILDGQIGVQGKEVDRAYSSLLENSKANVIALREYYVAQHEKIIDECFSVPTEKKPIDRLNSIYTKK